MNFKIVIPARYASTRLPGKPLRLIGGKPMIEHVHTRARESGADEVVVATDDERIARVVEEFGGQVCLTSSDHASGTDRIEEVTRLRGWRDDTIVVNLQGDEPLMPPELLLQVAKGLSAHPEAAIATLCVPMTSVDTVFDPNVVKVISDRRGFALLFSRAPIPWDRETFAQQPPKLSGTLNAARHVGIYAYRVEFLRQFVAWTPSPLEITESLEQLRALWNGRDIYVEEACVTPAHGVDTEADLAEAERALQSGIPSSETASE